MNSSICLLPASTTELERTLFRARDGLLDSCCRSLLARIFILILGVLVIPTALHASSSCTQLIPAGGAYDVLRTSSSEELHQLLEDYMAKKDYKTHDEALNDGFSVGFPVYGVPLKANNTFSKQEKDKWYSEYRSKTKIKIDSAKQAAFESLKLNVNAIKGISHCIISTEGFGLIATFEPTGDCTGTFSAFYRPIRDGETPPPVTQPALRVQGGVCDRWPKSVVGFGPSYVNCKRNGRDELVVTINTTDGPGRSAHMEAMPPLGPEPTEHDVYDDTLTKPSSKVVELYHASFHLYIRPTDHVSEDLGDYRFTFYSDISSPNGGPMTPELLNCQGCGGHFWLCPDNGICPHPVFQQLSPSTWRLWGFRNSDQPPILLQVKINYFEKERTCVKNCGSDVIYANWVAENRRTCSVQSVEKKTSD